jgi:hypothetical protein
MSTINVNRVVDTSGGVLAPISSVMRNRIINGAMVLDQRNAGASVSIGGNDNKYCTDRWNGFNGSDGVFALQQISDAPAGFTNSLRFTTTTVDSSLGATQFVGVRQMIEGFNVSDLGFGSAGASSVTLSFWTKSSLTGTFGGALLNSAENRSYPFSYTINSANTWEQKSITIAGDTTGTWLTNNGVGFRVVFGLGVGSTYSGTAGAWTGSSFIYSTTGAVSVIGTLNATWQVTGVQLEVGTQATSFEYRQFTTELQLCQRYYWKNTPLTARNSGLGIGFQFTTTGASIFTKFPVSMRTDPTVSQSNTIISDGVTYDADVTSLGSVLTTFDSCYFNVGYATSGAQHRACMLRSKASGSVPYVDFSAEL